MLPAVGRLWSTPRQIPDSLSRRTSNMLVKAKSPANNANAQVLTERAEKGTLRMSGDFGVISTGKLALRD